MKFNLGDSHSIFVNPFYRTHDVMTFRGMHLRKPFLFIRATGFNMALLTPSLVTGGPQNSAL